MSGLRRQPRGLLRLDRSHPLAHGLVFAAIPGGPELVSGVFPVAIGGGRLSLNEQGRTFESLSNSTDGWYWPVPPNHPIYSITTEDSSFILMRRNAGTVSGNLFGIPYRSGTWATPFYAWTLSTSASTSTTGSYSYAISAATRRTSTASGFYTNGKLQGYGVTRSGTRARYFAGGAQVGADATMTGSGSPDFVNRRPPVLFNRSSDSIGEGMTAQAAVVLIWNRELSPAEWKSVNDNPWQLFDDASDDEIMFVTAAAPARHTATVATTTQGATSPGIVVKQRHKLTIGGTSQSATSASVSAKARAKLVIAAASQSSASPAIAAKARHVASVASALQANASPAIVVKQRHKALVGPSAQSASSPGIVAPQRAAESNPSLVVSPSSQASTSPAIIVTQRQRVTVGASSQSNTSVAVLARARHRLTILASNQLNYSPSVSIAVAGYVYRIDPRRVLTLGANNRSLALGMDDRRLGLGIDNRILETQGG